MDTVTLRFEGYSDDTFGEYASTSDDYDNCGSGERISWLVTAPDGDALLVIGQHCPGEATGWLIGVAPYGDDDDKPLPAWPITIGRGGQPYSPALTIDAPAGTTIRCLQRAAQEQP